MGELGDSVEVKDVVGEEDNEEAGVADDATDEDEELEMMPEDVFVEVEVGCADVDNDVDEADSVVGELEDGYELVDSNDDEEGSVDEFTKLVVLVNVGTTEVDDTACDELVVVSGALVEVPTEVEELVVDEVLGVIEGVDILLLLLLLLLLDVVGVVVDVSVAEDVYDVKLSRVRSLVHGEVEKQA
jgi:hypothetical protein